MKMTSKEKIKSYLGLLSSDTVNDDMIDYFCDVASEKIQSYVGGSIIPTTQDFTFISSTILKSKILPYQNIKKINKVTQKVNNFDSGTEIPPGNYTMTNHPNKLYIQGDFQSNMYYNVNLIAGYDVIPADVEQCAVELSAQMYKDSDLQGGITQGRLGLSNIAVNNQGGSSTYTFNDIWERWKDRLKHYRIYTYGV